MPSRRMAIFWKDTDLTRATDCAAHDQGTVQGKLQDSLFWIIKIQFRFALALAQKHRTILPNTYRIDDIRLPRVVAIHELNQVHNKDPGSERGAMGAPDGEGAPEHDRPARRRGHGRHRARQSGLKGVLPKDYARPPSTRQRLGQLIDLISNIRWATRRAGPRMSSGACTSTSSRSSPAPRARRAASSTRRAAWSSSSSRCSSPTRAASTTPAAAPRACSCSPREFIRGARRHGNGRHLDLRPGVELHHLAAGQDEPRHPRHRRPNRPRRHLPQRPPSRTSRPTSSSPTRPSTSRDWGGELLSDDKRWAYGVPPAGNANFAWVQHIIHHLAPTGMAGFVLANGSMSSNQSGEGEIRKNIVEADLVDCMVALPGQLFYSTQIPAASGSSPATAERQVPRPPRPDALHRRPQARPHGRPHPPRAHRRRHRPHRRHLPRLARRKEAGKYEDVAGFCKARRSRRSASTATCSRPAATSAPRRPRTTASRSTRR